MINEAEAQGIGFYKSDDFVVINDVLRGALQTDDIQALANLMQDALGSVDRLMAIAEERERKRKRGEE